MSSRTAEDDYIQSRQHILAFEQQLASIGTRVTTLINAYQNATNVSLELFGVFNGFYVDNPERLTDVSTSLVAVHENIAGAKCAMLDKFMSDHVLAKIASCKNDLIELKRRMRDRETARENYDHYYSKFLKLKADKTTLTNKGKFGAKDAERYSRNEDKFRAARQAYNDLNDAVIDEMKTFWTNRFLVMDPIFNECARTEILFITALNNQLKPSLDQLKQAISQPLKAQPARAHTKDARAPQADEYADEDLQPRRPSNPPSKPAANGAARRAPQQSVLNLMDEPVASNGAQEPLGDFFSPSQRAPARPTQSNNQSSKQGFSDPFAALDSPAVSGAMDPFFAPPAATKRPADVDFFSNAMSVSASSPSNQSNAFNSSPSLFDVPSTSSKSKPSTSSFSSQPSLMDGLPSLGPESDVHGDDPFAGLPLQSSPPVKRAPPAVKPSHVTPPDAFTKPVVKAPATPPDAFAEAMQQQTYSPPPKPVRPAQTPPRMPSLVVKPPPGPLDIDSPEPVYEQPQRKSSITGLRPPPPPMPAQSVAAGFDDDDDEPGLSPVSVMPPQAFKSPPMLSAMKQPPPMPRPPAAAASPASRPSPAMPPSGPPPGPPRAAPPSRPPPSHASFQPPPPPSQRAPQVSPPASHNDFDEDSPRGPAFHVSQQGSDPFSAFNDE